MKKKLLRLAVRLAAHLPRDPRGLFGPASRARGSGRCRPALPIALPVQNPFEQLQEPLRRPPSSPPRVRTAPDPRSAPPPPRRSPSFGCSQRGSAPSVPPPRSPAPGSRLPAPGSPRPALGPCGSVPGPSRPAPSPSPKPLLCSPPRPRSLAVCLTPPHPHIPPSVFCLLARSLALRRGEAASQKNPRNLCKKLTMKFKKFFDFGAIFEWIERRKPGSSRRPPSGRTTPAPAGSLQRDAAKEHYINTLGPDLDPEDSCFKKIQSSLKSCNLYAF
ncbi:uncharacterized protein AAG666_006809 [Megaptera novaeangliae]